MKFSVPSKQLHSFASSVSKVINAKNALTILNNFLFEISGNVLTITASDGENTLRGRVGILDAEGEGEFCIDARRLVELLREMPEQELMFTVSEDTYVIEMTHPNGSYKFMGLPGEEFPHPAPVEAESELRFSLADTTLQRGLDFTAFAAGTDQLRPQMMGVYLDIKPDRLVFVATDTHKLVKFEDESVKPEAEGSFILPNKSTNVIRAVFNKGEEISVRVIADRGVVFESDTFTFDSRIIKGRFPDYNRVIPTTNPYDLIIDRRLFITALRRVSHFVDEGHGLVKFKITPDKVVLRASDNEYNTSGEETLAAEFTGNELIIGFSSSYLNELVSVLWTDEVIFKLADPSRPAVILPSENKPESSLTTLLMPMNIRDI